MFKSTSNFSDPLGALLIHTFQKLDAQTPKPSLKTAYDPEITNPFLLLDLRRHKNIGLGIPIISTTGHSHDYGPEAPSLDTLTELPDNRAARA